MVRVGDFVKLAVLPPWVAELPEESQRVFRSCVGKTYRIARIDRGLLVLDVSGEIDPRSGGSGNGLRVEEDFVEPLP